MFTCQFRRLLFVAACLSTFWSVYTGPVEGFAGKTLAPMQLRGGQVLNIHGSAAKSPFYVDMVGLHLQAASSDWAETRTQDGRTKAKMPQQRQSAAFVDYTDVSQDYDNCRFTAGVDIILGAFAAGKTGVPLHEQRVLDCGCGTGNYMVAIADKVGEMEGIDHCKAMVGKAAAKFANNRGVRCRVGDCMKLPFEDESFDGVMWNQVVQHLDQDTERRPAMHACLREMFRVLKPGGVIVMSTRSKAPCYADLYWYASLMPLAVAEMERRVPSREQCEQAVRTAGFEHSLSVCPLNQCIVREAVFTNPRGPFDPAWRRCESFWSLVSDAELEQALACLAGMLAAGTAHEFVAAGEGTRKAAGQTLFVCGTKP